MKKKIPKRDKKFQSTLLKLNDDWIENYENLILINEKYEKYALAGQWRPEIYYTQRHLCLSLIMAYTNNHKNVHDKLSRRAIKAYHLTFGFVLFPACWDKLAQLLREFLEIKKWINKKEANENNTSFIKVLEYLRKTKIYPNIQQTLNKYWEQQIRCKVYEIANEIKHRWSKHYIGIKTKISNKHENFEKSGSYIIGDKPVDEKVLYKDISLLKKANNLFVKCTKEIDKIIFDQFYD